MYMMIGNYFLYLSFLSETEEEIDTEELVNKGELFTVCPKSLSHESSGRPAFTAEDFENPLRAQLNQPHSCLARFVGLGTFDPCLDNPKPCGQPCHT